VRATSGHRPSNSRPSGNEVIVIERDEERAERASRQYDCLVLNDDATSKETLRDGAVAITTLAEGIVSITAWSRFCSCTTTASPSI